MAGLYGKLPAHGDFVRRGWSDATVDALDRWLSAALDRARTPRDAEAFSAWMQGAPMWRGFVLPGTFGRDAMHVGVAPSVDRAGRLFALVVGIAGEAEAVRAHADDGGDAVVAAIYDALGGVDADATVAAVAASVAPDRHARPPATSLWWCAGADLPPVEEATVDAALLERLLCREPA